MKQTTTRRFGALVALFAMVVIGGAAGDAVTADRMVLVEYFTAPG